MFNGILQKLNLNYGGNYKITTVTESELELNLLFEIGAYFERDGCVLNTAVFLDLNVKLVLNYINGKQST